MPSFLTHCGVVDSDYGPLLLAYADVAARGWHGVDTEPLSTQLGEEGTLSADSSIPVQIAEAGHGLLWGIGGPGTVDVYRDESGIPRLVRAWTNGPSDDERVHELAEMPVGEPAHLGSLRIESGVLAILWYAEDGSVIEDTVIPNPPGYAPPSGIMTTESSGLLIQMPNGAYDCIQDLVAIGDKEAIRLWFVARPAAGAAPTRIGSG